ncbi:uncharacterized protein LOC126671273 [Mercurialis annua]|uniref:uncharacterized protein LOC126671273 n=1 Tax=Mercurialis annua TaxID=3986 RepID=UPI0021608E26|nr:uncharacterized protein LOC126671273 [Mercurialis annua]
MAPHDLRRPFKRAAISDQQRRRDLTLQRQEQSRRDAQQQARCLASTVLSLQSQTAQAEHEHEPEPELLPDRQPEPDQSGAPEIDVRQASRMKGAEARKWFARQLMLPEWMIDVPDCLPQDWYVFARPAGKRCFVVSCNGITVSRQRNGSILHRFPSALPNGAKIRDSSGSSQSYCILDCIFHELDQTYYVIDMVCWRDYPLYDCSAEFRFFWLNSKLGETGSCDPPSSFHKYRFSTVPVYNCDQSGLWSAYTGDVPYVKDGLLFYNKHAHYQMGNTPLALVWKDEKCSQYVIDTDSKGEVLSQQQVVLELQDDGSLVASDDPPVAFGCLHSDFIQQEGLRSGNLVRFSVCDGGLSFADGKVKNADLHYLGKPNKARAFADSYSKIVFQHMARHSPLKIDDLLASVCSSDNQQSKPCEVEMSD